MNQHLTPPPSRRAPSWPWWLALALIVGFIFAMNFVEKAPAATPPDPARVSSPVLKIYGRYMMGVKAVLPHSSETDSIGTFHVLNESARSLIEKLRVVPLMAEVAGPGEALAFLDGIDAELAADPAIDDGFRRDAAALREIYLATPGSTVTLDQPRRDELIARHGWFARLALTNGLPETDPARGVFIAEARRTITAALSAFAVAALAALAGFVLFIIAIVLFSAGSLRPAFLRQVPADFATQPSTPHAFLEAFVLFLTSFIAASLLGAAAEMLTGVNLTLILAWPIALLALWPLSRGVTFAHLRGALGWHAGRGIFREIGAGILGHLAGIPIILLGLLVSAIIISLSGTDASHPITDEVNIASPLAIAGLFLMTTVWAPLVEETFFRGALYAHLRGYLHRGAAPAAPPPLETSPPLPTLIRADAPELAALNGVPAAPPRSPRILRALPAALITGFIFAAIHPQGFGGIPVLTALGFNFCLMREWRGSLIAPITAHALHNGAITLLLVLLLS